MFFSHLWYPFKLESAYKKPYFSHVVLISFLSDVIVVSIYQIFRTKETQQNYYHTTNMIDYKTGKKSHLKNLQII